MRIVVCSSVSCVALALGAALVLAYGSRTPYWLMVVSALLCGALALLCGFTPLLSRALPWLRLREVRGAFLVVCGVAAMFVPPQFVASAAILFLGIRLVWAEAGAAHPEVAVHEHPADRDPAFRSLSSAPGQLEDAPGSHRQIHGMGILRDHRQLARRGE
jgi:hypothetical protein